MNRRFSDSLREDLKDPSFMMYFLSDALEPLDVGEEVDLEYILDLLELTLEAHRGNIVYTDHIT